MGRNTQDRNDDVVVKDGQGYDHSSGQQTADFIIAYRDGSGDHEHVVISTEPGGGVIHDTTGSA